MNGPTVKRYHAVLLERDGAEARLEACMEKLEASEEHFEKHLCEMQVVVSQRDRLAELLRQVRACARVEVKISGDVNGSWPELIEEMNAALAALEEK